MFDIDLSKYKVIDLSYEVVPPGSDDRPFVIQRGFLADMAYKYDVTKTHSHVGTHVEMPAHFFDGGKEVTDFPLSTFFGRAILLEIDEVGQNPAITSEFTAKAIGNIIKEGDIVICRNNDKESLKNNKPKPYLTPDVARWFKAHKIKLLGIDNNVGLSKDIPTGRELHDILMGVDVPIIEWLDNLDQIKNSVFFLMALPFKVKTMDSSWARVIAIEELDDIKMANENINENVKKIIPGKSTREQVIEVFGKPNECGWEDETFSEKDLPDRDANGKPYVMCYNNVGVNFAVNNKVWEVRVHNKDYSYEGKIGVDSSVEDVFTFFGKPSETVTGEPINWHTESFYKDIEGKIGYCYVYYKAIGVRMFFSDYKVCAFYLLVPGTTP